MQQTDPTIVIINVFTVSNGNQLKLVDLLRQVGRCRIPEAPFVVPISGR
jgi:hypothetical protein